MSASSLSHGHRLRLGLCIVPGDLRIGDRRLPGRGRGLGMPGRLDPRRLLCLPPRRLGGVDDRVGPLLRGRLGYLGVVDRDPLSQRPGPKLTLGRPGCDLLPGVSLGPLPPGRVRYLQGGQPITEYASQSLGTASNLAIPCLSSLSSLGPGVVDLAGNRVASSLVTSAGAKACARSYSRTRASRSPRPIAFSMASSSASSSACTEAWNISRAAAWPVGTGPIACCGSVIPATSL